MNNNIFTSFRFSLAKKRRRSQNIGSGSNLKSAPAAAKNLGSDRLRNTGFLLLICNGAWVKIHGKVAAVYFGNSVSQERWPLKSERLRLTSSLLMLEIRRLFFTAPVSGPAFELV